MRIIDSHQHFWKYNAQKHSWINEEMRLIQKDFLPTDLKKVLNENNVEACVSVQVDQSKEETLFQIDQAEKNTFVKGVVGWIDVINDNIEADLKYYEQYKVVKGFRHILQGAQKGFMLQPSFIKGLNKIAQEGYSYDLLIYHQQLEEANELLNRVDDLQVVLNHIAKPNIKERDIKTWSEQIKLLAKHKNLSCKISGIVTEADWTQWTAKDIYPYLDVIVASFGMDRIMFGSDWPVCLVASTYEQWLNLQKEYFKTYSTTEQEKFFALNCERFYKLGDQ